MTYFTESQKYGRTETVFDSKRFLANLVEALGGANADPEYNGGRFDLGELTIYMRQGYGAKARRVTLMCRIADNAVYRRAYSRGNVPSFPSITIDPDRPIDALVRDIKRRVIEASAEPLAAIKAADAAQSDAFAALKDHAARINAKFPGAVTLPAEDTAREARLYVSGPGGYISARLQSDGGIYVERVGGVEAGRVESLLAVFAQGSEAGQ